VEDPHFPVASVQFAVSLTGLVTVGIFLALAGKCASNPWSMVAAAGLVALPVRAILHSGKFSRQTPKLWLAIHITSNIVGADWFILRRGRCCLSDTSLPLEAKTRRCRRSTFARLLQLETLMRRLLVIGFVRFHWALPPGDVATVSNSGASMQMRIGLS